MPSGLLLRFRISHSPCRALPLWQGNNRTWHAHPYVFYDQETACPPRGWYLALTHHIDYMVNRIQSFLPRVFTPTARIG